MPRYSVGIDTGGTHTDAAIIEAESARVVATAKALTTKGDLAIGVAEAIERVLSAPSAIPRDAIALVCLSTTLATNAIVEQQGSAIGAVFIGFDAPMVARSTIAALPGTRILNVTGGHDYAGNELAPLDEEAVTTFARSVAPDVEAFAVAGLYSVRNPAHEWAARELIHQAGGRYTTLSSDLAHELDAPKRALTAALNARIIAPIGALIAAVRAVMARLRIAAELMIVKGDGSLAPADVIVKRPIETILSGPAASVIGAQFLSHRPDFIMADIGGTTTDIAILNNGWPKLNPSGATVGGRQTLVRAIDMHTFALGGDTDVDVDGHGAVALGSRRVIPLALLGDRYPDTIATMRALLAEPNHVPYAGRFALRPFGHTTTPSMQLSAREQDILSAVNEKPIGFNDIVFSPAAHRALNKLVGLGLLQVAAFTPTDAAHILHKQCQWSREAAHLGAALLLNWRRTTTRSPSVETLAADTIEAMVRATGKIILRTLAGHRLNDTEELVEAVVDGTGRIGNLNVALAPSLPIVAVGGPAPLYYPEVGNRLGCDILLPEHGEVANAIGAAVGTVHCRVAVDITTPETGVYRVHHGGSLQHFSEAGKALAYAGQLAETLATQQAAELGAHSTVTELHVDRTDLPNMLGDQSLIAATVVAECWGAPTPAASEDRGTGVADY
jgi:N-methylhydantoinase A/oxoprolinase/acetone carboxylase beta subunit